MREPEKPPEPSQPATEVAGRIGKYSLMRVLGKGAMGVVYLAHDTVLDRDVALKVMVAGIANDPELKQRFEREARAVAKLTHPSIVTVFDLGSHSDGSPYIAMELLRGQDLAHAMRQGPMTVERIVSIIARVLAGLNQAHQAGIVHRDIKPANIFLNAEGGVKIMDFGVARLTTASMTGTGNVVGTADYMSPEQVKGAKVDGRSDLFSVGSLFFELLTGRRPFHADNLMAIFYRITQEEPDLDLVPSGPAYDPLRPILEKALAKDLDQRYKTAYEFMADLREYLRVHGTSASEQTLEGLLDIEAPGTPPPPLTGPGTPPPAPAAPTEVVAGTIELEPTAVGHRRGAGRPGPAAERRRPVVAATVMRPGTPAAPRGRSSPPWGSMIAGVTAGMLLTAIAYVYLTRRAPAPVPPPLPTPVAEATLAATPELAPPAPTPEPTPVPVLPTPVAAPTFAVSQGRGAAAMRAGQAAFARRDYDPALTHAQKALAEDPSHSEARKLVESALSGQRAETRFRAAETALGRGDYSQAAAEAEAGRALAPWDTRATDLLGQALAARERAERDLRQQQQARVTAQIAGLLGRADEALAAQKYDVALNLYDEALKIDPQNARAGLGRTGALTARATALAAASTAGRPAPPAAKSFVSGKTVAQSVETRPAGAVPEGFEDSAGVAVRRGTQAMQLPGKIVFEVRPDPVRVGETYSVTVSFANEGASSIPLKDLSVTTTVNGRRAGGPIPLSVSEVAPRQKAVLLSQSDLWREEFASWSMEVTVRTGRGETYRNQVTWR